MMNVAAQLDELRIAVGETEAIAAVTDRVRDLAEARTGVRDPADRRTARA
jgi:hypothetical protein